MLSRTRHRAASRRTAFARGLMVLAAVFVCAPSPATAQSGGSLIVRWPAAPGPVVNYDVYASINGGPMIYYTRTSVTSSVVGGPQFQQGDALRIQVVGVGATGAQGPPSAISDVLYFPNVPAPTGLAVQDGSAATATRLSWNPVPYVQSYVVFRSETPGANGQYLGVMEAPVFDDQSGHPAVLYYYSVVAINGRQVSDFTGQVAGFRRGTAPELVAAPSALAFQMDASTASASQTIRLSNIGDWALSFRAWPGAQWIELPETVGVIDDVPVDLQVIVNTASLSPGVHQAAIQVYPYPEPLPGETPQPGAPLRIPITVSFTAGNSAPVITSPLQLTVKEGQVLEFPITATDPDANEPLTISMGQLPSFAVFEDLGGGQGRLTLAPDYEDAGVYAPMVVAQDNVHYAVEALSLTVEDVNRAPQAWAIPDTEVNIGDPRGLLVFAWDPDPGDRVALTTSPLPSFVSFTDLGGGRGQFVFNASSLGQIGQYLIIVGVVDDGSPSASTSVPFVLNVRF